MKIAIHSPRASYFTGGTERYVLSLVKTLIKQKKDVYLVTYDAPKKSERFLEFYEKYNKRIFLLKNKYLDKNFERYLAGSTPKEWDEESKLFSISTNKLYKKKKFDKVVYHYCVDCLYSPNSEIILHLHGLPDKRRRIESEAIKKPEKIIAVSKYVADGWKELYGITKKIGIVHNGISKNKKLPTKKKTNDFLYFGRLIKIKGVEYLIKAFNILAKKNKNYSLKIVGDGPEKETLVKLVKNLNLDKQVIFLGKLTDLKLKEEIRKSKISIFPSYAREGVMTTVLEAINEGSVVISSDACSNKEFLDNTNSIFFHSKDFEGLSKKMKIINNNKKINLLRKKAFLDLGKLDWKKQAKQIFKIYVN